MKCPILRRPTLFGSAEIVQFMELLGRSPRILSLLACSGQARKVYRAPISSFLRFLADLLARRWPPLGGGWHQII